MDSPRLLLVNSTAEERQGITNALHDAGMAIWARALERANPEGIREGSRPAAAIVCGDDPAHAAAIADTYPELPIIVLSRRGRGTGRAPGKRAWIRARLTPGQVDRLPKLLHRELSRAAGTQTRKLLETAVAATQDVVILSETRGQRIISCNPATRPMFGYAPSELVGDTAACLFPDRESFDAFRDFLDESLDRWGRCDTELELVRRDGGLLNVSIQVTALPPAPGVDDWIVTTIRDTSPYRNAERAVSETREHLDSTLDSLQDAVITVDPESRTILSCNTAVEAVFGYTPRELIGSSTAPFLPDQSTFENLAEEYARALEERGVYRCDLTIPHRDGHAMNVEVTISALSETLGWREGIVASIRDVTQQKKAEERARLAESVVQNTVEGVMITDLDRRIVEVNPAFERLTGYTADEILGRSPDILRSGRHDEAFYQRIREDLDRRGFWQGEIWHRRKGGEIFPAMASSAVLRDDHGNITHYSGIFTDISHHKHVQERLEYLTRFDPLTGLPNRASFEEFIDRAVRHAGSEQPRAAVFFLDIDHFKTINETLGHAAGDRLLREVAERLAEPLDASCDLARLGGDEFGIIARGLADPRDAASLSKQLLDRFREPFNLEGRDIYVSASIGISLVPEDGVDARNLMKNADSALFRAKELGRNHYEFFSREMNVQAFETLVMVNSLRQALERDEFELHYQPRVNADDGRILGAEALVRWNHPDLGLTTPNQFIGIAEQTGLIGALGDWVMKSALTALAEWRAAGLPTVELSVNLSAREFAAPDLAATIKERLASHDLDSSLLELEITESMLMSDPRRVEETLHELRSNGVRVVIDDFGTGYSSLNYLKHFPISGLKIDQSFVRGIPQDADDMAITRAIIAIARSLNLRLIAEGVETEEQAEFLRHNGCHELQGFLFSPPVKADRFRQMLASGLHRHS